MPLPAVISIATHEPPFPQRAVTQTLMDTSFFGHEEVWVGAGSDSHMASLRPAELLKLSGAKSIDLGGPRVEFARPEGA